MGERGREGCYDAICFLLLNGWQKQGSALFVFVSVGYEILFFRPSRSPYYLRVADRHLEVREIKTVTFFILFSSFFPFSCCCWQNDAGRNYVCMTMCIYDHLLQGKLLRSIKPQTVRMMTAEREVS